jgi:hypothetical protein
VLRARTAPLLLWAILALVACGRQGLVSSSSSPSPSASSSTSASDAAIAQRIANNAAGQGKAEAAAYVKTTWAKYVTVVPDSAGATDAVQSSDPVLVIKVYGSFISNGSLLPGMTPPHVTVIISVYDLRNSTSVAATELTGPAPDVTGGADVPGKKVYADLRLMGTPQQLSV